MVSVFIADDHAIVRQGLHRLLDMAADFKVAGESQDGWHLADKILKSEADLLLMDMNMPGPDSQEIIREVREKAPHVPVLVLSMMNDIGTAGSALKAGAAGYITKDSDAEMILRAIRQCADGEGYIQPELGARLVKAASDRQTDAPHERLSSRERQVFMLLAQGLGINAISERLHISPKTVSTHKFRIMQKMNLATISEIVRYAIRHQLIEA